MRSLANIIARLTGSSGKIIWDRSKPDGQPRRRLNVLRAKKEFGFEAKADFIAAIKRTIRWYRRKTVSQL
jgi:GDP-L-fucose synthase